MSPVVLTLAAAICLASQISASAEKPPPATTPAPDLCLLPPYDVAKLKGPDYWYANISGQPSACIDESAHGNCTYYMAFCHELRLNVTANCNGSAVCQVGYQAAKKKQFSYSMGMYEVDEVQFHESNNAPSGGFFMDVSGGSNVSRCNRTSGGLSTTVRFECNESAVWTGQNLTNFISVLADDCKFVIILQYSGACNRATTPTPTRSSSSATKGHMTHTSTRNFTTTHSPHIMTSTSKHTTVNMTTHSMPSTAEHSSTKHTGSSTTSNHVSPTKSSTSTRTHSPSTSPTSPPRPPPHTTHPHTTKPTENPLQPKVTGLTAGVVIFALLSFILLMLVIGAVYFVYKRGGGKYRRVDINDE